jgi:hypothetical protein
VHCKPKLGKAVRNVIESCEENARPLTFSRALRFLVSHEEQTTGPIGAARKLAVSQRKASKQQADQFSLSLDLGLGENVLQLRLRGVARYAAYFCCFIQGPTV